MAETLPPDKNRSAGKNRGGKSGKVADFRYKRPPQPDSRSGGGREPRAKGAGSDARRPVRPVAKGGAGTVLRAVR